MHNYLYYRHLCDLAGCQNLTKLPSEPVTEGTVGNRRVRKSGRGGRSRLLRTSGPRAHRLGDDAGAERMFEDLRRTMETSGGEPPAEWSAVLGEAMGLLGGAGKAEAP